MLPHGWIGYILVTLSTLTITMIAKLPRAYFSGSRRLARPRHFATVAFFILSTLGYSQVIGPTPAKGIEPANGAASNTVDLSPMAYHGGPIMTGTPNVHYIFYGTWTKAQINLLNHLAKYLGESLYYNILTEYPAGSDLISSSLDDERSVTMSTTLGKVLSDTDVQDIVSDVIHQSGAKVDSNGIYLVLTSADISQGAVPRTGKGTTVTGFCNQYCGWHSFFTFKEPSNSSVVKYGFIGNPSSCLDVCAPKPNEKSSPNGDPGVDAMASMIAHEIAESVTDPELNAWYDAQGNEVADKCAWTYGITKAGGAKLDPYEYNIVLGGVEFLIQQLWSQNDKACEMSYQ